MRFKILEGKPERESPKRTISVSSGHGRIQMVSEPDIGQCASEEAESRRGWTEGGMLTKTLGLEGESHIDWRRKRVPARTLGPEGVDCEIPPQLERKMKHSL